jgi:uncharacterized protein (DUF1501 family)
MNTLRTRREFLRATVLGGALSWTVPSFLAETFHALEAAAADARTQQPTGKDATILVVVQLAGGNDGLNTLVPHANDEYYRARPKLAIRPGDVLKLNDDFGLHPTLTGLKSLWDEGRLAVVQGVGYPNPNRSHFRSTEIWQTASEADRFERHGWLGRYFDNACPGRDATAGVSLGRQMPQAFAGPQPIGVCLESPERFRAFDADPSSSREGDADDFYRRLNQADASMASDAAEMANAGSSIGAVAGHAATGISPLDFLERVALDAQASSDTIRALSQRGRNQATYPVGQLAADLRLVARLIAGGMTTRVYYVSQGGYDTHTNQAGAHQRLLSEMGGAVKAFLEDLTAQGNERRVMLMTFSEFGRRVAENANGGTDHGAAAPMFLAGGALKNGLLGKAPSLAASDLLNGDPRYTTDFRRVYASVLESWLRTPSAPILGRKFEPLPLLAGA